MWTSEQLKAIETTGTNIIVSAGAGSGKTTVLTERVIRKLKQGIDINKLLILTFTDAASQEMKERIREAIKKDGTIDKQLDLITTAYICTFDSFSLSMVRKYHYLLNIDSNVNIMDNNINYLEIKKTIDNIFDDLYESKDQDFCNLIYRSCLKDDKEIKEGILSLYKKIDLLVEKEEYINNYFDNIFNKEQLNNLYIKYENYIKDNIKKLLPYLDTISVYFAKTKIEEYIQTKQLIMEIIEGEKPLSGFSLVSLPTLSKPTEEVKKLKEKVSEEIKSIKETIGKETKDEAIEKALSTINDQKVIFKIIKELDNRIYQFKKQCNTYTFMDIAKMAIKIFKENDSVREEFKYCLNEIMIDEYQDTSDIQEYFINLIADNNVYMVGDIKQSIYRFRNANPYLFQSKYDNYGNNNGGIKIDLTNNFRSRKEVVYDINKIFSDIMTQKVGGAEYQKDHIMQHGNISYNSVASDICHNADMLSYIIPENSQISKEEIEAFIVASDIKQKVDNHYQVMDKKTKQARDCTYNDFVILLSKSKHFDMYKQVFNYFQIPLNIYKNEEIEDDYDIKVVLNILKLIISNNFNNFQVEEKYCITSILRSYLFSYSDNDLFAMYFNNDFYNNKAYDLIKEIRNQKDILSIGEILELIDDKFNILLKAKKIKEIKKILVHLEYLNNLSSSLSTLGYTLEQFTNYLQEVFENELKIEYQNKLSTVENAVKIMTIHKSKGLEFGICYFATLQGEFNFDEIKNQFIFDNNLGIIMPLYDYNKQDTFLKSMYKFKEKQEIISEQVRVLYVALTRAKEKIIFVTNGEETKINFNKRSFKHLLDNYFSYQEQKEYTEEDINKFISMQNDIKSIDINNLKISNEKINVNEINIQKEKQEKQSFSKRINELISKENVKMLELGTSLHKALERVDFNTKDLSVLDIDSKYHHYITSLLNCDILENVKTGKVYKEYQFYDETRKVQGSIDLMIEYENYIDIIDYKLKHIDDEGYLKQLNGYKNYIYNKTKKDVNIYLYSIIDKTYKKL